MGTPRLYIIFALFLLIFDQARATHIVGGELYYDYLGGGNDGKNIYRVTLVVFRDCKTGTADFDGIGPSRAFITVRDADGGTVGVFDIGMPVVSKVPPTINSPCMDIPQSVCVEQGVYVYTLSLTPRMGGHYIIYQRCCRNNSIQNLAVPGQQGSTYFAFIPGPEVAAINSSPRFTDYPPIFLCNDLNFNYTQAATDPDGDKLVYKFSAPFRGLDVCCPAINSAPSLNNCPNPPVSCPSEAANTPYEPVIYVNPYSPAQPASANPPLAIDPHTGAMSGAPNLSGQYVVSVTVEEYRDGKLLNKHFRDFQFNMINCSGVVSHFKAPEKCQGFDFSFSSSSLNGNTYKWDFGVPGIDSDTSHIANPRYFYPDTGIFLVSLIVNPGSACSDTDQKVVKVFPPLDISFQRPPNQCLEKNTFNFAAQGSYASNTIFRWTFDGASPGSVEGKEARNIHYTEPGGYFVKLSASHFSCTDSLTDSLRVLPMPQVEISTEGSYCAPATLRLKNTAATDSPMKLNWTVSNGLHSNLAEPVFKFTMPDVYTTILTGTTFDLCKARDTMQILILEQPQAGFEVHPETVTVLEPEIFVKSTVTDAVKYIYTFGDGSIEKFVSGAHAYYSEGQYLITQHVVNYFGCVDSVSKIIHVLPEHLIWVPNVFTPNGDGRNDTFGPFVMGVDKYELRVFDRWGTQIFISNDPFAGWDGTYRSALCQQGAYTYKLSYKNIADDAYIRKAGHVLLLRND